MVNLLKQSLLKGSRRALAKAITLIESNRFEDQVKAQDLLADVQSEKKTIRVGISGVPGVGKSTFIEALGMHIIKRGHKVAVLAVDPSSPTTGGSILGDKTRMESLATNENAFIRPSPTSGTLGGVTKKTRETIILCESAGYDVILVETVGVGQSEFEVASMVDCFMVLMLPGAGDSLQGIKRGILEITDLLVVNKADGDQKALAERAKVDYMNAFHLLKPKYEGIPVEIYTCSALQNKNIDTIWEGVESFIEQLKHLRIFDKMRKDQAINWFKRTTEDRLIQNLWDNEENKEYIKKLMMQIQALDITPSQASDELLTFINIKDV